MEIVTRALALKLDRVRMVGEGLNEIISIQDALSQAEEQGLDLVIVSDNSTPPVVRIQDFKKLEYERKKARKASPKANSLKEVQFKINISDHDLGTKIARIQKFLAHGDKVKVSVRLKGREREHPERARELIKRVGETVECKFNEVPGPVAIAILEPVKSKK